MNLKKTLLTSLVFSTLLLNNAGFRNGKEKYSDIDRLEYEAQELFRIDSFSGNEIPLMDPSWELMPLYQGENPILPYLFDFIERDKDKENRLRNDDFLLLYLDDVEYLGFTYRKKIVM